MADDVVTKRKSASEEPGTERHPARALDVQLVKALIATQYCRAPATVAAKGRLARAGRVRAPNSFRLIDFRAGPGGLTLEGDGECMREATERGCCFGAFFAFRCAPAGAGLARRGAARDRAGALLSAPGRAWSPAGRSRPRAARGAQAASPASPGSRSPERIPERAAPTPATPTAEPPGLLAAAPRRTPRPAPPRRGRHRPASAAGAHGPPTRPWAAPPPTRSP
jgi:hypothetical protein